MLRYLLPSLLLFIFSASAVGQSDPEVPNFVKRTQHDSLMLPDFHAFAKTPEQEVSKLQAAGSLLLHSKNRDLRSASSDTILAALERVLIIDSVSLANETLTGIAQIHDGAGKWSIYTWQQFVDDSTYVYGGVMHLPEAERKTIPLFDRAQQEGLSQEFELTPQQWYGALYYDLKPFKLANGKQAWLLFGYDADGFYHRRKVADVLLFSRKGMPMFGAEVFRGKEGQPDYTFSRLILEYRVDARVGLRFDEALQGIVHDRLVIGPPVVRGAPPSQIPDGSYDGYVLDEQAGIWNYREEWFDRVVSPTAPRPNPVLDSGTKENSRDLFGRPRKVRTSNRPVAAPR